MTTDAAFVAAHRAAERRLCEYLRRPRKNSVALQRDVAAELDPASASYLPANNADARIQFARITARHLDAAIAALPDEEPIFFVTFIIDKYAVREDQAAEFVVRRLHAWAYQSLRGSSYVGMVEAALFTNANAAGAAFKRAVSWHGHLLVWGISEEVLAARCAVINQRHRSLVPGILPAHYRRIERAEVVGQTLYMLKAQLSEYRVWPRKGEVLDRVTGEMTIADTGRFSVAKREMRAGDMARMCRVFAGRHLDELAFAGGAGRPVLKAVRLEALSEFTASQRRAADGRSAGAARERPNRRGVARPRS